jgi:hypothetical protein
VMLNREVDSWVSICPMLMEKKKQTPSYYPISKGNSHGITPHRRSLQVSHLKWPCRIEDYRGSQGPSLHADFSLRWNFRSAVCLLIPHALDWVYVWDKAPFISGL